MHHFLGGVTTASTCRWSSARVSGLTVSDRQHDPPSMQLSGLASSVRDGSLIGASPVAAGVRLPAAVRLVHQHQQAKASRLQQDDTGEAPRLPKHWRKRTAATSCTVSYKTTELYLTSTHVLLARQTHGHGTLTTPNGGTGVASPPASELTATPKPSEEARDFARARSRVL